MSSGGMRRSGLALWLSAGACAAAAFWISMGVSPWRGDTRNVWHHYEYLAEGFVHGHTYLSLQPAPQLLALKDPYDPAANAPYRLWDATLYNGRYYLYFGPAPLILFLPWRILTGTALPQNLAAAALAALGLAGLARLLWEVRGRHFPRLSDAGVALIAAVAFHASWLPVTLRRSGVWDVPVVSATAFAWWSLYLLWRFHESGGRARWALATGAALALLMASRVTFVPGGAAIALLMLVPAGGPGAARSRRWGAACAGAAVAAAGGIALLAYNRARFGSWTEFGLRYVLFGEDYRAVRYFSASLAPFNAWAYLFSAPQLGPYFPFLHPYWSDATPAGFVGFEEVYGVLFMVPVHLAGLAALAWAARPGAPRGPAAAALLAGAAALSLSAASVLFCWAWACSRYTNELLAGWTVATAVGLMAIFGSDGGARPSRLVRALAALASLWSVACVWLASAEFRGFMAQTNPRAYAAAAHLLDYPGLWAARARGVEFGPLDLAIRAPGPGAGADCVLLASGRVQRLNQLVLSPAGAGRVTLRLVENEYLVLSSPPIDAHDGVVRVRVAAPWLYPPAASPYWDGVDPALRGGLQTLFSLAWDGGAVSVHSPHSADPVGFEPEVRRSPEFPGGPFVEAVAHAPQAGR
jgi:4-amino-4-deoxy-L-arabinose transferase-like glycosyltransferase